MAYDALIPTILHYVEGGALSLATASVAAHYGYRSADRLPGESRHPQCVFCLRPLEWYELFPLVGWCFRKNALRFPCPCGKREGLWPQPLTEAVGFLLGLLAVALYGWTAGIVALCIGLGLLPAIGFIDLLFELIPDELTALLAITGLWWQIRSGLGDVFQSFITSGGLIGIGLLAALGYSKWRGKEMLGLGDVKFFGAAGLWLSAFAAPWFLGIAGLLGAIYGALRKWKRPEKAPEFPFAPALCISLALCLFGQILAPYVETLLD